MTQCHPDRLGGNVIFSHAEGATQPTSPVGKRDLSCVTDGVMEVGERCRTDPGRSSDSGILGSGTHSWVLGPHPDALGTCKSGSWGAIVGEELVLRGLGETPKQPAWCRSPASWGRECGGPQGSWRWDCIRGSAFCVEQEGSVPEGRLGPRWRTLQGGIWRVGTP